MAAALFWLLSLAGIGALVNLASSSIDHDSDPDLSFDLTLTDPTSDTQLDRKNNTRFHYSN